MIKASRIFAAALSAAMVFPAAQLTSFAEGEAVKQTPVFEYFNANDVNGSVIIQLPESVTAEVSITFDSPEGEAEPYYLASLEENGVYSFDIEGRDNTEDDYRTYDLSVTAAGGQYGSIAAPFTDTFTVPDVNDNPDSFAEMTYIFAVDDVRTGNDWDVSEDENGVKTITLHLDAFLLGDVNEDGKINASDASKVLEEYSALSTTGESILTNRQKLAANVNGDDKVNANDASRILMYYSAASTGGDPTWD